MPWEQLGGDSCRPEFLAEKKATSRPFPGHAEETGREAGGNRLWCKLDDVRRAHPILGADQTAWKVEVPEATGGVVQL